MLLTCVNFCVEYDETNECGDKENESHKEAVGRGTAVDAKVMFSMSTLFWARQADVAPKDEHDGNGDQRVFDRARI